MLYFHLITTPSRKTLVRKLKCFVSLNCFSDKTYGDISSSVSRTTLKTSSVINESIFSHSLDIIRISISDSSLSSPEQQNRIK